MNSTDHENPLKKFNENRPTNSLLFTKSPFLRLAI